MYDMEYKIQHIQNMRRYGEQYYLDKTKKEVSDDFIEKANDLLDKAITNRCETLEMINVFGLDYVFFMCVYANNNKDNRLDELLKIINDKNQNYITNMILANKPKYYYDNHACRLPDDEDAVRLIDYIAQNINKNIYNTFDTPKSRNLRRIGEHFGKEHNNNYHQDNRNLIKNMIMKYKQIYNMKMYGIQYYLYSVKAKVRDDFINKTDDLLDRATTNRLEALQMINNLGLGLDLDYFFLCVLMHNKIMTIVYVNY